MATRRLLFGSFFNKKNLTVLQRDHYGSYIKVLIIVFILSDHVAMYGTFRMAAMKLFEHETKQIYIIVCDTA
jgi:hypothetical protein